MRFGPVALALSALAMVTASMGHGAPREADPRAVELREAGVTAMQAGEMDQAVDAFEAALVLDPGFDAVWLDLAYAARGQGMQGKAIRYYRTLLERSPKHLAAISGEGQAMVEKGAVEKARRNLAMLESLCGANCPETEALAEVIANGPQTPVVTAEAIAPAPVVTQN